MINVATVACRVKHAITATQLGLILFAAVSCPMGKPFTAFTFTSLRVLAATIQLMPVQPLMEGPGQLVWASYAAATNAFVT